MKLYIEYIDVSRRENNDITLKENDLNKELTIDIMAI